MAGFYLRVQSSCRYSGYFSGSKHVFASFSLLLAVPAIGLHGVSVWLDAVAQPQPYQPKTHRLKSRIPQGAISVAQYRDWLTQQLALLNSFNEKDSVNLNE